MKNNYYKDNKSHHRDSINNSKDDITSKSIQSNSISIENNTHLECKVVDPKKIKWGVLFAEKLIS